MIRLWYSLRYVLWLTVEVLRQSVRLARDVLTPGLEISPSIIEFPLRAWCLLEGRRGNAMIEGEISSPGVRT